MTIKLPAVVLHGERNVRVGAGAELQYD